MFRTLLGILSHNNSNMPKSQFDKGNAGPLVLNLKGGHAMEYSCRVVVKGRLGREWSGLFDGWRVVPQRNGTTLLEGTSVDEASLQGLLDRLRPLPLVYAHCVYPRRTKRWESQQE